MADQKYTNKVIEVINNATAIAKKNVAVNTAADANPSGIFAKNSTTEIIIPTTPIPHAKYFVPLSNPLIHLKSPILIFPPC